MLKKIVHITAGCGVCVCDKNYVKEAKRVTCLGYISNEDSASKEPLRGLQFTNVY